MKKLILLPFLFLALFSHAQASYEAALGEALGQMQAANSPDKAQGVVNRMSRIADAEPKAWLPAYYAAFSRINLSFMLKEDQQRETLLDQAQTYLDRALKLQPKESELYVLQGYLHQARLVISPMMRGMKYSGLSTAALEKARELNPHNPRVYYMLGQNTFNTPAMFGGGPEAAKPILLTAKEKYAAYAPANALAPNWGEKTALSLLAKCQ